MTSFRSSLSQPSDRVVTLRDIADTVGISIQSVSGVLNGGETQKRVSPQTRDRILMAAEELGYRRNQAARSIRTGSTRMIGWLGGDLSEEHVGKMLSGALEAADDRGYTLKILRLEGVDGARQAIRRSSELRLAGVLGLHLSVEFQTELRVESKRYGYPLVLMDERSDGMDIPQVVSDDEGGIREGVRHLVELGHRNIAFISAEEDPTVISRNRERAFQVAMAAHGLPVPEGYMVHGSFSVREPSIRAANVLLSGSRALRPTAIFGSGDFIALATLQVAQERGISVPGELSIIGFANMGFLDFVSPRLTTIEQPFVEIGRRAVRMLLMEVEKQGEQRPEQDFETPKSRPPMFLPTRLIVGATTGPPPL